jgi:hypothetical protein
VLLANTLIEHSFGIQKSEADLKSYRKSNQELLDEIKAKSPDLYEDRPNQVCRSKGEGTWTSLRTATWCLLRRRR